MRRIKISALILAFIFILPLLTGCQSDENEFRFVFLTDIHCQQKLGAVEGFKAAIEAVNLLDPRPDFVVTGGDLVFDVLATGYEHADSLYNLYAELIQEFNMPVYNTIGNHEIFGWYPNSGVDAKHPEFGKKMFANRLGDGRTYRSFDHKGWHFVLLDAMQMTPERNYRGEIDLNQMKWLEKDLSEIESDQPVVLVTHIPFYSIFLQYRNGPMTQNSERLVVTNAHEVNRICDPYNLKAVLQGHLHTVEEINYYGVKYITAGAVSGSWWQGPRFEFPEGFAVIDVSGDELTWHYEDYGWDAGKYAEAKNESN
ncbi:MAG: metallophosphoesterase [candidate division KSB1 bacterium]|jgi:3',5'-cyclic AMP phosphodiesterase CpdA|nr:metallophosphoesterase [candidate division KSB1 bacterium]